MIILYQFPRFGKIPSYSPFCLKVETFLRMMGLPYENSFMINPSKAPKGKLPYINLSGQVIADSELIITALKEKYGDLLDADLSPQEKATAFLLDKFFCEYLFWLMIYFRWQDAEGWQHLKKLFFRRLPAPLKLFVPAMLRKKAIKALYLQGIGRHSREELVQMVENTLQNCAHFLGNKKYFFGEEITSVDATAFAFLANVLWFPFDDPLKLAAQQHQNLREYCHRMWHRFYFEMEEPFALI